MPRYFEGELDLWKRDKYHFQKWMVEQVDGFVTMKGTADGRNDGRRYFNVPKHEELQRLIGRSKAIKT